MRLVFRIPAVHVFLSRSETVCHEISNFTVYDPHSIIAAQLMEKIISMITEKVLCYAQKLYLETFDSSAYNQIQFKFCYAAPTPSLRTRIWSVFSWSPTECLNAHLVILIHAASSDSCSSNIIWFVCVNNTFRVSERVASVQKMLILF
jgi:hypothetical protein